MMNNQEEIWKDVKGYEGLYEISNIGRLKSLRGVTPHIMKFGRNNKGYLCVAIHINGKNNAKYQHRLMMEAFVPNPENKVDVNHINGIKTDNRLDNLEWNTRKENTQHALDTGLRRQGEDSPLAKISDADVVAIREKYYYTDALGVDLAAEYNINPTTVRLLIQNKRRKTAGGPVNRIKHLRRKSDVKFKTTEEQREIIRTKYAAGGYTHYDICEEYSIGMVESVRIVKGVVLENFVRKTKATPFTYQIIYNFTVEGYRKAEIARLYELSTSTVGRILKGLTRADTRPPNSTMVKKIHNNNIM